MRSLVAVVVIVLLSLAARAAHAAPDGAGVEGGLSLGGGTQHWVDGDLELGWRFLPWLAVTGRASAILIDDRDAAAELGVAARLRGTGDVSRVFVEAQLSRLLISEELDCLGRSPGSSDPRCVGGDAGGVAVGLTGGVDVGCSDHACVTLHAGVTVFDWRDHSTQERRDAALVRVGLGLWFY